MVGWDERDGGGNGGDRGIYGGLLALVRLCAGHLACVLYSLDPLRRLIKCRPDVVLTGPSGMVMAGFKNISHGMRLRLIGVPESLDSSSRVICPSVFW